MVLCSGAAGGAAGMVLTAASDGDALPLGGEESSVFLVLRQTDEFNVNQVAVPFVYGSGDTPRMWFVANNKAYIGAVNNGLIEAASPALDMTTHVISCTQPASGVAGWIDGFSFGAPNTTFDWADAGAGVAGSMNAWLFSKVVNGQHLPFQGAIAEVLVLDELLGDAERQAVEGYLAWKWGAQSALPFGHPFRAARPNVTIA